MAVGEEVVALEADVLVIGGGGAGMFAALAAASKGTEVILLDKNVVGRGGATVMAQMTCAAALGEAEPDSPEEHLKDTLEAGRGLCNEALAALLCENSPKRIRDLEAWNVNWARRADGRINQVKAPGHSRKRCVYVDFLKTGAAISAALRNRTSHDDNIRKLSNLTIVDLVIADGEVVGAVGLDVANGRAVLVKARATILALGGMTKMFRRTTAPNNLAGEGIGLALRAGARIVDLEFLQFYPNGHLAPRMVGLDPTTWEPTRVKLGGKLLNGLGEEFLHNYDESSGDSYTTTRDRLTYAMYKEVEAGRGTPHGGVYLSFQHIEADALQKALGPFMKIFRRNNIDLTKAPVEVFPIAHYQMGGVEVNVEMETRVPGLYAAGELVGGANGANRLSGNALPEAMTFGERAGRSAARYALKRGRVKWEDSKVAGAIEEIRAVPGRRGKEAPSPAALTSELRELMWTKVGAFRNETELRAALVRIRTMRTQEVDALAVGPDNVHNTGLVEWFELRNGLYAAEALAFAALMRRESRGAHQRMDHPEMREDYCRSQHLWLADGQLTSSFEEMAV